jgi:AcrR family transcriptional regulator
MKRGRRVGGRPYHHGDLRRQLLAVAEEIILERGVEGFTLREAARRAGVSPAAPAHHFGDARGLLTEVALLGFQDLGRMLERADAAGGGSPARRLAGQAHAYVRFALEHPARFQLMFRDDKLDLANEPFRAAAGHAYRVLERAIRAASGTPEPQPLSAQAHGLLAAAWSSVHGFAHLALSGQLQGMLDTGQRAAANGALLGFLLPQMLQHLPWAQEAQPPAPGAAAPRD